VSAIAPRSDTPDLRVAVVDPAVDRRWTELVDTHPRGSIWYHPAWLEVLHRAFGYDTLGLACEDADGRLCGLLPLARAQGRLVGRVLSSLPHTPVAGPLAVDRRAVASLLRSAADLAEREHRTLLVKTDVAGLDGLLGSSSSCPWSQTYVLDLPAGSEPPRFGNSRNHGRVRWAVGKAEKAGVRARLADGEADLRRWYRLYAETMRWHTTPPLPYSFFEIAWQILQPRGLLRLWLAEHETAGTVKLLAGSIFLAAGRTCAYAYNGRHREDLSLRPNDLIQWHAIHDACRAGLGRYDFGEVAVTNHGLAEFKSKWGAEPRVLYRLTYPGVEVASEALSLRPGTTARELGNRVWRRLPLTATILLGGWVQRRIGPRR
jgi:CelD/BcsL family acetyltransferase involved in cellulose biosynthesis